jgi:hypothetical protein
MAAVGELPSSVVSWERIGDVSAKGDMAGGVWSRPGDRDSGDHVGHPGDDGGDRSHVGTVGNSDRRGGLPALDGDVAHCHWRERERSETAPSDAAET